MSRETVYKRCQYLLRYSCVAKTWDAGQLRRHCAEEGRPRWSDYSLKSEVATQKVRCDSLGKTAGSGRQIRETGCQTSGRRSGNPRPSSTRGGPDARHPERHHYRRLQLADKENGIGDVVEQLADGRFRQPRTREAQHHERGFVRLDGPKQIFPLGQRKGAPANLD